MSRRSGRKAPPGSFTRLARRSAAAIAIGAMGAVALAEVAPQPPADARSIIPMPQLSPPLRQPGYQLVTDGGDVLPFGAAASATAPGPLRNPMIAIARTPSGDGTWTATSDGGVFTSGDAPFFGSLGSAHLNQPIVGLAPTPTGLGYWLVAADGGVFTFGDASFRGGLAGTPLNEPVVAMAPTRSGRGYWMVSADGGVFAFGDAAFEGSLVKTPLIRPVVAMAPTPTAEGYWLTSADGGVFAFGDAPYLGRPPKGTLLSDVVGIAASRTGRGYWLASRDGGVFTFGDAPFLGSSGGAVWGQVVGIAAGDGQATARRATTPRQLRTRYGHDISWPQCDKPYPVAGYGYGIIGVTGGRPFTQNRCLGDQWRWALAGGSGAGVYVNVASPKWGEPAAMHGPAGACLAHELPCQAYNHSANNMTDAMAYARSQGVDAPMWWLDVEVLNRWSPNQELNALTVRAATETLRKAGLDVGAYSTHLMWRNITGGLQIDLPVWLAGAPTDAAAPSWCHRTERNFTGHGIWLIQSIPIQFDVNWACDPLLEAGVDKVFRFRD